MLFNTLSFLGFFILFYVAFSFVARTRRQKLWLIIVSSLLFYSCWDIRPLPLVVGTGILDFYIARALSATEDRKKRRRLLAVSVGANILVLAVFKYTQFVVDNTVSGLRLLGLDVHSPTLSIILPIGISFYTFQSISYTVDVYRGTFTPRKRFADFLGALTFFPHLVAGPIVRSSFILPQFEAFNAPKWADCRKAFLLIAFGLAKKSIADVLGVTADRIFDGTPWIASSSTDPLSAMDGWTGALAFIGQIYGDFSGYTDMALGIALLLGFQLPKNFDLPYLSRNINEFWRRWHISLSSWLRDYLYLPLAGRRQSRVFRAAVVTMLLGGLWHGAQWNFVLWGLYHGLLLAITTAVLGRRAENPNGFALPTPIQVALTFYLVTIGGVIFRSGTLAAIWRMLRAMHAPTVASDLHSAPCVVLALIVSAIVLCHAMDYVASRTRLAERWLLWPSIVLAVAMGISLGAGARSFIYFQF